MDTQERERMLDEVSLLEGQVDSLRYALARLVKSVESEHDGDLRPRQRSMGVNRTLKAANDVLAEIADRDGD